MRAFRKNLSLSLSLILCLVCFSQAETAGRIKSMKLMTTDVGWAATDKKLFWTTDNGAHWTDITPKLDHKTQTVSSVFFLDASRGWALLKCADEKDALADDVCFEFASTTNSGETWVISHPKITDPAPPRVIKEEGQGFSGRAFTSFSDGKHGWAILKRSLHVQASSGEMLRTVDGGKRWTQLPQPPIADNILFVTDKDGWIAGGGQPESDLYVTHNGGESWSQVVIQPPTEVKVKAWPPSQGGVWPDYHLPFFESEKHGFLIGNYWNGSDSVPVLFSTVDTGTTWRFERTLPNLGGVETFVGETLVTLAGTSTMERLTVSRIRVGDKTAPPTSRTAQISDAVRHRNLGGGTDSLVMIGDVNGWLLADNLLATADGGATWVDISPTETRVPASSSGGKGPNTSIGRDPTHASAFSPPSPPPGNVSAHISFDKSRVPCPTNSTCNASQSLTAMQALMNSSPFYDTSLYLPGSPNRGTDPAVNLTWVQGAEQQGWGLIPTWFGLQSSCIINQPNVKQFFGPTVAQANTDGTNQADQAVVAAQALGITSGIIYTDIENYTVNSTCSPVVQSYVKAWVTEIHTHSGYLAGVYANPGPINSDISNHAVARADAIWITKTPASGKPPLVTIWNQGITDALWPNNQRIHQFLIDQQGVSWGGIAFTPSVDEDIDDAPISNANAGAKVPSSYSYQQFNYSGSTTTGGLGINDIWDAAFINGSGLTGQIVGYYQDSNGSTHGFLLDGLVAWTPIDYPGGTYTEPWGINNSSQIVGTYNDSSNVSHGFRLDGSTFTTINYPGSTLTNPTGINDAGQIVGSYADAASNWHGFIFYKNNYYAINYPGPTGTQTFAYGINGDGVIVGYYRTPPANAQGFACYPVPPNWTGTYTTITYAGGNGTFLQGASNNNVFCGYFYGTLGNYGLTQSGNVLFTVFQYPNSINTYLYSTNDFGQGVGLYNPTSGVNGFVVTPQP